MRVDEITSVRFVRRPYPFPSFPKREVLTAQFLGPDGESVLHCYVQDVYDGQRMRPEKLAAWRALRERYVPLYRGVYATIPRRPRRRLRLRR